MSTKPRSAKCASDKKRTSLPTLSESRSSGDAWSASASNWDPRMFAPTNPRKESTRRFSKRWLNLIPVSNCLTPCALTPSSSPTVAKWRKLNPSASRYLCTVTHSFWQHQGPTRIEVLEARRAVHVLYIVPAEGLFHERETKPQLIPISPDVPLASQNSDCQFPVLQFPWRFVR